MFRWLRNLARARIRSAPFPAEWQAILERNVPYYGQLPPADRAELRSHILVFLHEKRFEGCGGLEITDEVKVTIAAQACVLLLHRSTDCFPLLGTILVYPHAYSATFRRPLTRNVPIEGLEVRRGESWHRGVIVLSWDSIAGPTAQRGRARNVVFHEFAHQLDDEAGAADGAPDLGARARYVMWARVFGREYQALQSRLARGEPTLIDAYGSTSPAEFFAVTTEHFFEIPRELRDGHPELYDQLRQFYRQDPAALVAP